MTNKFELHMRVIHTTEDGWVGQANLRMGKRKVRAIAEVFDETAGLTLDRLKDQVEAVLMVAPRQFTDHGVDGT